MIFKPYGLAVLSAALISPLSSAEVLQKFELENGSLLPGYSSAIDSPFNGIAAYANNDGVEVQAQLSNVPGQFRLDIRGASSANNAAGISVYLGDKKLGSTEFSGTAASVSSINFKLDAQTSSSTLQFKLESDNGSNDTYLDWFELHRVGDIASLPAAPVLPNTGAYESGIYRNMFQELGYSKAEVDAKVQAVYDQLFHSTDTTNQAIFIPVGNDMAYIWDVGNNDVRSEGMSYGMMMAVQMGRQEDFNKLWKWAHTYSLNKSGNNKGYFAWKVSTAGNVQDANPAPDGEEYFATALFFASNRWGDGSGIYNYREQANQILKDMYGNGQTRYNNQGQLEEFSLFSHEDKQIVFSPATPSDRNWTDPSYHLPAFYELWARWADNNNSFWADLALTSRAFLKTTVNAENGLSPDYAYFDGRPHGEFQAHKVTFQYDAWRTVGNAAMDFAWWNNDPWQTTYVNSLQTFFKGEGIDSYSSLYELNGTPYQGNSDHSPGLVAMNAMASLASDNQRSWEFVQALWDTPVPSGKWRYYDGTLYMFGMLALSGNYQIICPAGECDAVTPPPVGNRPPVAVNDSASTQQDTPVTVAVLNNDRDLDGDSLSIASFTQPNNGAVSQVGDTLNYTPNSEFFGEDSFSYTITDGEEIASANVTIAVQDSSVNNPPSACFSVSSEAATVGQTVSFDAACSNYVDNDSLSFSWDFGDTNGSTGAAASHSYASAGTYHAKLTVTDANGGSDSFTSSITVTSAGSGASCSYSIDNEWNSGFVASITIANNGSAAINGWEVNWAYVNGSTVTNSWNTQLVGTDAYTASSLSWNSTIQPGQTVSFGMQGNKGVVNTPAELVTVNGTVCN
ncbi:glycosyl hydrolase family 8 [Agarivorans sp. DSG3-1]|uniref:glycosyl hydrolase family 8 n=1 Tax=Agarivorans sp. DSG3-1 TaxID=3342249 RepID=UPI00398EE7FD